MYRHKMDDIKRIRYQNYRSLFDEFKQQTWRRYPDQPEKGMLKLFSEKVGLSPRFLSHINNDRKAIGHGTARRIERGMKVPHGWLDQDHERNRAASIDEQQFLEGALSVYRASPVQAQAEMIRWLTEKISNTKSINEPDERRATTPNERSRTRRVTRSATKKRASRSAT